MSLDALRWAFQQTGIKASHKFVLVALADRANEADECFPSVEQIRLDTNLNKETICAATTELERLGLIEKQKRYGGSVVYRLVGVPNRHQYSGKPEFRKTGTQFSGNPEPSIPETRKLTYQLTPIQPTKKEARFAAPTVEEVAAFVSLESLDVDPAYFVDHYTGNGWKVGKAQMKDWQATARNWHRRNAQKPKQAGMRGRSIVDDLTDRSWAQ